MNILSRILYEQNKELLKRIADDNFSEDEEKEKFINKYNKLNYVHLTIIKKENVNEYKKKYEKFSMR